MPASPDREAIQGQPFPPAGGRRIWPALRALLKTRIVAGLLTVIPIWVTWKVVQFVFDLMRSATQPVVERVAQGFIREKQKILPASIDQYIETVQGYVGWIVPLLAVLLTLFLLYLLGLLTANVVGSRMLAAIEAALSRLPLVKTIYNSTKQIVTTVAGGHSMHFQRVVMVEFPHPGMKCVGFLTAVMEDADTGRKMASVFIATTPNPTTGYMQIVPLDRVSETGWTMEDAVKLLMSGGIISPSKVVFDRIHEVRWPEEQEKDGAFRERRGGT